MAELLRDALGVQDDEPVVLSVCAHSVGAGWGLAHATLLAVPQRCAELSWSDWYRDECGGLGTHRGDPLPTEFLVTGDDWLLARSVLTVVEAEAWLHAGIASIRTVDRNTVPVAFPALGAVPALSAELSAPAAVLLVVPRTDSATSSLLANLGRPAQAMRWRGAPGARLEVPDIVEIDGQWCPDPTRNLTGIHITPADLQPRLATARGLLVGRATRRAWIREAKGEKTFAHFNVDLAWDPALVGLADLELIHDQYVEDDLASSVGVRLDDFDLGAVEKFGRCRVCLMSLGRGVRHGLILRTLDGELLDRSGPYPLVERVAIGMTINGEEQQPVVLGEIGAPRSIEHLSKRARAIEADVRQVLQFGAQARIIADRATALARLVDHLEGAVGELCILDRYFGQHLDEWRLLDTVPVPVRVLTGKVETNSTGAPATPTLGAHVTVRFRKKAPIHERIYFWDGGGIVLGGSPSTFGQSPLRITRLRQAEVAEWRSLFEVEWVSPLYSTLQGRLLV
jgi:hypothetical protein